MRDLQRNVLALNLGCGPYATAGWLNCDLAPVPGVDVRTDLRRGLPFAANALDCIAAIHVLQDLAWNEIAPALQELHRVLKPGGVLRLAIPDLDRAIHAYLAGEPSYFYVPDRDARSIGAKLVTQIVWYGSVRTPCTFDFLEEWLHRCGYRRVTRRTFGVSDTPGLANLDNRARESLFIEAEKR